VTPIDMGAANIPGAKAIVAYFVAAAMDDMTQMMRERMPEIAIVTAIMPHAV
jgi:hypothetical protein